MHTISLKRRTFLGGSALALVQTASAGPSAASAGAANAAYQYEITRSDAEWRDMLSEAEFKILRRGDTEMPHSSPLVKETAQGVYCCKGCDLTIYDSRHKVPLDIGWVFFSHSRENAVLTSIDGNPPDGMTNENSFPAMIEVHCRRCGSHLGHIVIAEEQLVHCINGTALDFRAADA